MQLGLYLASMLKCFVTVFIQAACISIESQKQHCKYSICVPIFAVHSTLNSAENRVKMHCSPNYELSLSVYYVFMKPRENGGN